MAEGTISAYNLADQGVNVDKAQIHKEDGELTKAQNCTTDTTGVGGGVRKRPGLIEFNASPGSGNMLGGVGVPLALTVSSVGGTSLGAVVRKIYWGRATRAVNFGASVGWWTSLDAFATAAVLIGTGSTPEAPRSSQMAVFGTTFLSVMNGGPNAAVTYRNKLFYASNDYTQNVTAPLVRIFDGTVDREFARIPTNPAYGETQCQGILSMIIANEIIYLTVYDNDGVSTAGSGRVFSLDPSSGTLTLMGTNAFTDGYVPYCLAWHMGRLWVGTVFRTGTGSAGTIHYIRPGIDTTWTLDRTQSQGRGCSTLCSFQGQLFAGASGTGTTVMEVRSSVGTWSVSLSIASNAFFLGAIEFKSNLYVSFWVNSGSLSTIRKFNGSAWSTAYTGASGTAVAMPMSLVDNGILFFGGGGDNFNADLVTTTDGTTWTDRTANLTGHSGTNVFGVLTL